MNAESQFRAKASMGSPFDVYRQKRQASNCRKRISFHLIGFFIDALLVLQIVTPTTNAQLVLQDLQVLLVWTVWPVLLVLQASLEKMVAAVPAQAQAIAVALRAPLDHLVHLDLPDLLAHPETKALLVPLARLTDLPRQDHPVHQEIQDQLEPLANLDPRDSQAKTQPQAKAPLDPRAQPDLQAHLDLQEPQEPLLAVHLLQDHQDPPGQLVYHSFTQT